MKLPAEMAIAQIAQIIGGRVEGDGALKVKSVAQSPLAAGEGDIAFVFDKEALKRIADCKASAVVVPEGTTCRLPMILVERPTLAIQKILTAINAKRYLPAEGIHPTAIVDASAKIGKRVAIGPLVVVGADSTIGDGTTIMAGTIIGGAVEIGSNCLIHPGCLIADFVKIGNRVILQQGASLGSDGFGYVAERPSNLELRMAGAKLEELSDEPNPLLKIPQIGTVVLEDDVEIGSCATVDRATIGATRIGQGSKIDNQVMIAHNAVLGREVLVVAHSGIAGSCKIGDRAVLAGHVAVTDHRSIGKDAIAEGRAGIMWDAADGEVVTGTPALPKQEFFKLLAHYRKLPQMASEMRELKKRLKELEEQLGATEKEANGKK